MVGGLATPWFAARVGASRLIATAATVSVAAMLGLAVVAAAPLPLLVGLGSVAVLGWPR